MKPSWSYDFSSFQFFSHQSNQLFPFWMMSNERCCDPFSWMLKYFKVYGCWLASYVWYLLTVITLLSFFLIYIPHLFISSHYISTSSLLVLISYFLMKNGRWIYSLLYILMWLSLFFWIYVMYKISQLTAVTNDTRLSQHCISYSAT